MSATLDGRDIHDATLDGRVLVSVEQAEGDLEPTFTIYGEDDGGVEPPAFVALPASALFDLIRQLEAVGSLAELAVSLKFPASATGAATRPPRTAPVNETDRSSE